MVIVPPLYDVLRKGNSLTEIVHIYSRFFVLHSARRSLIGGNGQYPHILVSRVVSFMLRITVNANKMNSVAKSDEGVRLRQQFIASKWPSNTILDSDSSVSSVQLQ